MTSRFGAVGSKIGMLASGMYEITNLWAIFTRSRVYYGLVLMTSLFIYFRLEVWF